MRIVATQNVGCELTRCEMSDANYRYAKCHGTICYGYSRAALFLLFHALVLFLSTFIDAGSSAIKKPSLIKKRKLSMKTAAKKAPVKSSLPCYGQEWDSLRVCGASVSRVKFYKLEKLP